MFPGGRTGAAITSLLQWRSSAGRLASYLAASDEQSVAAHGLATHNGPGMTSAERRQRQLAPVGLHVRAANGRQLRDWSVQRLVGKLRAVLPWLEPADLPTARSRCEVEVL